MYKAVINKNELYHFNKNHSPKNGQFTSGDGDGDGISDDHKNQRKSHNPITHPYSYSSAAAPAKKSKLSKSSMFKTSSFAEFKKDDGTIDNAAYTKSGIKKMLGGIGGIAVGKLLQGSNSLIASGVGFATEYMGWFAVGYGAVQTTAGVANQIHNARQNK